MYGAKLVKLKWVRYAWNIKLRVFVDGEYFRWMPYFPKQYEQHFSWLFFQIRWEGEFHNVPDGVAMDLLSGNE